LEENSRTKEPSVFSMLARLLKRYDEHP